MRRPVRIVRQPRAQSGFEIKMNPGMGFNANQLSWPVMAGEFSAPETKVNDTLQPTDWDQANLEAEKGETVVTNLNYDGIPEHYKIGGKRHYEGGTPLNLPPNSFIFSRDKSMRIKDEQILKMFNMTPDKKGYTPADIAKQYNINKYRRILADPDTEDLQRETAEMMITNYNLKLGKLALVQESLKGFPQGIPQIAMPYIQTMNINPEEFAQTQAQPDETGEENQARYGKQVRRRNLPKHDTPPGQTSGLPWDPYSNEVTLSSTTPNIWNPTGSPSQGAQIVQNTAGNPNQIMTDPNVQTPNTAKIDPNAGKNLNLGSGSGRMTYTKKDGALNNIGGTGAAEGVLGAIDLVTMFASGDEARAAEAAAKRKRSANYLFKKQGMDTGNYIRDSYAGVQGWADRLGQQQLDDRAVGNMPGQYVGVKYGGEREDLPKAQFGISGTQNSFGFMGPGSKMVGMRFNPAMGVYEAINRRGQVIGFFRPGQGQAMPFGYPGYRGVYGSTTTSETPGTTVKKKVKKQVIPEGAEVIDRSKYTNEEDYIKARDEAFAKAGGKKTVYTKASDGKYYTVGEGEIFEKGDTEGRLKYLSERFSDKKLADEFKERIKKVAANSKALPDKVYIGGKRVDNPLKKADIENMSSEELVKEFLEMNKRNLNVAKEIKGQYGCYDNSGKWKGGKDCDPSIGKKYPTLDAAMEGVGMGISDAKKKALQQLAYLGYEDLLKDKKEGKIKDKDIVDKLEGFEIEQLGVSDEDIGRGVKGKLSPADTAYTNTTAGQVAGITGKKRKEDLLAETETEEEQKIPGKKKAAEYMVQTGRAPWWIQDIVKTGAAFGDWARLKKRMPWMPPQVSYLPEATYYDPNRQLAANAEASANILQNLAAFQGPQTLSSRASQIFGQTAKGAADIMAQYNNMNVGVANNMALQRANILNNDAVRRSALAKQNYDETTIANQQFDNANTQALNNIVNSWVTGKTNAVNAYNMNLMFPQYHTHPEAGGLITFEGGRPVKPDLSGKQGYLDKFKEYKQGLPSGIDDKVIWDMVKSDMSGVASNEIDPDYLKAMSATMQGMRTT